MTSSRIKAKHIILFACVMLIGAWCYAYYFVFDVVEEEVLRGYGKKAKRYRYLAAEMYLDRKNIPAEYRLNYSLFNNVDAHFDGGRERSRNLLTKNDTLVLINTHGSVSESDVDVLWEWVNAGGTLVASFENPYMGDKRYDGFTEALDLALSPPRGHERYEESAETFIHEVVKQLDEPHAPSKKEERKKKGENNKERQPRDYSDLHRCKGGELIRIPIGSRSRATEIRFDSGNDFIVGELSPSWTAVKQAVLNDSELVSSEYQASEEVEYNGKAAALFRIGDGYIYILKSTKLWQNTTIQCADNAYFLSKIVNPEGKVWFIENRHSPSLIALLLRYLPVGVLLFAVLLGFILWSAFVRFGPQFAYPVLSRRRFSEHVRADSAFIVRYNGYSALLSVLRKTVEEKMRKKVFQYEHKTEGDKIRSIKKLVKFDERALWTALFKPDVEGVKEFIECVQILQRLKGEL